MAITDPPTAGAVALNPKTSTKIVVYTAAKNKEMTLRIPCSYL